MFFGEKWKEREKRWGRMSMKKRSPYHVSSAVSVCRDGTWDECRMEGRREGRMEGRKDGGKDGGVMTFR